MYLRGSATNIGVHKVIMPTNIYQQQYSNMDEKRIIHVSGEKIATIMKLFFDFFQFADFHFDVDSV